MWRRDKERVAAAKAKGRVIRCPRLESPTVDPSVVAPHSDTDLRLRDRWGISDVVPLRLFKSSYSTTAIEGFWMSAGGWHSRVRDKLPTHAEARTSTT
ncbi:MAG: hypothetical protein ACR2NU_04935 [Aeoliella sp.]